MDFAAWGILSTPASTVDYTRESSAPMSNKECLIPDTRHLLLTGKPGCGKTTVIRQVVDGRSDAGGFYTGEVRKGGRRTGFSITTLDGRSGMLAGIDIRSSVHLGRYRVNVTDIDEIAASSVEAAVSGDGVGVVVIDEIASMEMASERFRRAVLMALAGGKSVLGAIQARSHPFLDGIRSRPDVSVIEVNGGNREELPALIGEWLDHHAEIPK